MPVTLRFLGHSAFSITDGDTTVLIDPFLTGNPQAESAGISASDLSASAIVITHGHADHIGDTPTIAKRTGATVYSSYEICTYLGEAHGVEAVEPGNPGGSITTPWGRVSFTQAFHSSSHEGRYMGMPMGVVVEIGGKTVYHAGDTGLFSDIKLIGELYKPDVAILPVGDRFTMGPKHAKIAAEWIGAPIVVPCHYGTWPLLVDDISAFTPEGIEVERIEPGGELTLG